jgi:hypothetical protein
MDETTEFTHSGDCRFLAYCTSDHMEYSPSPIMMEKSALAGGGWGELPPSFSLLTSRTKLQCTLHLRGQIHSLYSISSLPYMYSLGKQKYWYRSERKTWEGEGRKYGEKK